MKWKKADLQQYVQAKEYIDTIILPLAPFQFANDAELEKMSFQHEVLTLLCSEIEKELTGRLLLTPVYNYLKTAEKELEVQRVNGWVDNLQTQPFSHIFFISFDSTWKKVENQLNGTLLWIPVIQSGDLQSAEMHGVIKDQVEQLTEFMRSYW
ncbi:DUF2487 family protein [Virgibacillus sp. SK37]|uniref:DUF2487 family protein n=1 Tax=Virgibacillus sp. SK37 TaxID=403957 RepID=UPI0004D129DB|nr:DUF2487 family protein [Virgibacillus sp. SK37]AIF43577.1 hypothetical protein X953_10920 [Virgibacillus sp. SK37]